MLRDCTVLAEAVALLETTALSLTDADELIKVRMFRCITLLISMYYFSACLCVFGNVEVIEYNIAVLFST